MSDNERNENINDMDNIRDFAGNDAKGDNENVKKADQKNTEDQHQGGEDYCQKPSVEEESAAQKEENGAFKSNSSEAAAENDSKINDEPPRYSTSYGPPHYVPNFTVTSASGSASSAETSAETRKKSKSRKWLVPVVAIIVAVSMCIVGLLGAGIGYVFYNLFGVSSPVDFSGSDQKSDPIGDETITIIKNDGSIEVDEQLGSTGYSGLSVAEITALVADSVVEITTSQTVDTFYGQFIDGGAGSGVIIGEVQGSDAYYIVTNHHVIDGVDSVSVTLRNGSSYPATIVGGSELDDIALLRIVEPNGKKLTTATLGKSENLKVGDGVVAIGNPLGTLGGTVTDGIVSALDREIMIEDNVMVLMQTNAAINPGNSGGGLFNSAGELIGIVTAKSSKTGVEGLGFAIPIDRASDCINDLLEYGYVKGHSSLGVEVKAVNVTSGTTSAVCLQVIAASKDSSLNAGDLIYSINGMRTASLSDFSAVIYGLDIGSEINVQLVERNTFGQVSLVTETVKVVEYNPYNFS